MTRTIATRLSVLFAALALMFGGLTLLTFAQEDTEDEPTPEMAETDETASDDNAVDLNVYDTGDVVVAIEPTGENGYCTICHNQPGRTLRLQDGTLLNLYVAPELLASSVHGPSEDSPGLGCLDCHGEDSFPHRGLAPTDGRVYTLDSNSMCMACHENYGDELNMGLHAQAIADGNLSAAVCTDCHGAHHIQSAEFRPEITAGVCGDCHENTYEQWNISEHADIGPLGCGSCHDFHAQTLRVGETTTDLCLNCHLDNLPNIFVHDTHITAAQGGDHPVECADCHMTSHSLDRTGQLISTGDDALNHSMLLDATPCNVCHETLVASGEWESILAERVGGEAASVETDTLDDHGEEAITADRRGDTRFAIQGLLLGLGLGITLTIVFVTRNRQS